MITEREVSAEVAKLQKNVTSLLKKHDLTAKEINEYKDLNKSVFGSGLLKNMFVVLDDNNAKHKRLNELSAKVIRLNAWLVNNRTKPEAKVVIAAFY